ncbi:MAG: HAD family phosphatase [Candidatus Sulfotelmatobacter sp.]
MNRAVLWDMDGTLVDSAEYHWQAWRDTMSREGFPITHGQFLATFGQRNDSILRQWLSEKATPELIQRIGKAKEKLYRQLVREHGIAPIPGALEWVKLLHRQGWGQAIASAAPRANVETILDVLHASESFEAIVSAEDVHRGKPDPEVLLIAATKLGAAPKHCIVVEDAEHGIEAARAAGMKSIGVSQNGKNLPADIVVRSLDLLDTNAFDNLLQGGS